MNTNYPAPIDFDNAVEAHLHFHLLLTDKGYAGSYGEGDAGVDAPPKDCATCEHRTLNPDGGHCYLFETEPESDVCGQYRRDEALEIRAGLRKE